MFRRTAICLAVSLLLATACAPVQQQAAVPSAEVLAKARKGDGQAQLDAGYAYCDNMRANSGDNTKTLDWWKKAARSKNAEAAYTARQRLGEYYLGKHAYDAFYHNGNVRRPDEYKPFALCRVGQKVEPDFAKAEHYYRQCATAYGDMSLYHIGIPGFCSVGLGHSAYLQKKYKEAYYWYARSLVFDFLPWEPEFEVSRGGFEGAFNAMPKKYSHTLAYARYAREHLTPAEIEEVNKQALKFQDSIYWARGMKREHIAIYKSMNKKG